MIALLQLDEQEATVNGVEFPMRLEVSRLVNFLHEASRALGSGGVATGYAQENLTHIPQTMIMQNQLAHLHLRCKYT